MGDVGMMAKQRQVMLQVQGRRMAHGLLLASLAAIIAGVVLLSGAAWGLISGGVMLAAYALLFVDVSPTAPTQQSRPDGARVGR